MAITVKDVKRRASPENKEMSQTPNYNKPKYSNAYSDSRFWNKVKSVAKKAGIEVTREALTLWYVLTSPSISLHHKTAIIAALGYFISPIDAVPDAIPFVGFGDDLAALLAVHHLIRENITPEIETQADTKLKEWFD